MKKNIPKIINSKEKNASLKSHTNHNKSIDLSPISKAISPIKNQQNTKVETKIEPSSPNKKLEKNPNFIIQVNAPQSFNSQNSLV